MQHKDEQDGYQGTCKRQSNTSFMTIFPLCLFLSIEMYSRFCFVTGLKERMFALDRGSDW